LRPKAPAAGLLDLLGKADLLEVVQVAGGGAGRLVHGLGQLAGGDAVELVAGQDQQGAQDALLAGVVVLVAHQFSSSSGWSFLRTFSRCQASTSSPPVSAAMQPSRSRWPAWKSSSAPTAW